MISQVCWFVNFDCKVIKLGLRQDREWTFLPRDQKSNQEHEVRFPEDDAVHLLTRVFDEWTEFRRRQRATHAYKLANVCTNVELKGL